MMPFRLSEPASSMNRIAIVGCAGAGKSTLARRLGTLLGLPVIHLDRLYWQPGWVETPKAEWQAIVEETTRGERWISDGNYGGTIERRLAAADTIIFLDMPTYVCLWRAVTRYLHNIGRTRADLGPGCPEKIDWPFLWYIGRYRATRRARLLTRLEHYAPGRRIVILRSQAEVRRFLSHL